MAPTIFRKAMFTCGNCNKQHEVKMQVPVSQAKLPLAVPAGWGTLEVTAQHPKWGAIMVVAMPVCSEECGIALAGVKEDALPDGVKFLREVQKVMEA